MIRKHLLIALAAVALLLLGATACADDGEDTKTTGTSEDADAAGDESTDEDSEDEQASSGDDCPTQDQVDEINAKFDAAETGTDDPAQAFAASKDAFDMMAPYIPDDLQDDYDLLEEGITELADAVEGLDLSDPSSVDPDALAELEELTANLDSPEYQAASDRIQAYFEETCPDVEFES